jgi:hypothetical protein
VEGYAEIAAPLAVLGRQTARFAWTSEEQVTFDTLKQARFTSPVLRTFDPHHRAVLTTDPSWVAVAAILTQHSRTMMDISTLLCTRVTS